MAACGGFSSLFKADSVSLFICFVYPFVDEHLDHFYLWPCESAFLFFFFFKSMFVLDLNMV